jgi:hypothetical protein
MKWIFLAAAVLACVLVGTFHSGAPAAAGAEIQMFYIDVSGRYANPCGEIVDLVGDAKLTETRTGAHIGLHVNYTGVSGVGETTGARYVATDAFEQSTVDFRTTTATTMLRLIGQGSLPDVVIHGSFHITRNAAGDITSSRYIPEAPVCV